MIGRISQSIGEHNRQNVKGMTAFKVVTRCLYLSRILLLYLLIFNNGSNCIALHVAHKFARSTSSREPTTRLRASPSSFSSSSYIRTDYHDIGICTIDGVDFKRPTKVNQDAYFHTTFTAEVNGEGPILNKYLCCGIFDGHGKHGHDVTRFMAQQLPKTIQQQLNTPSPVKELEETMERLTFGTWKRDSGSCINWLNDVDDDCHNSNNNYDDDQKKNPFHPIHEALINSFHSIHYDAIQDQTIKSGRSGTTCVVCLIEENQNERKDCCRVHLAYVGDSRAILVASGNSYDNQFDVGGRSKAVNVKSLTKETTVQLPWERARIEQCEGTIRGSNVFYGPVGIAMTRALGDSVMLRAGVIPTPVVGTFDFGSPSKGKDEEKLTNTIILATDGVWDVLSNDQVAKIVETAGGKEDGDDSHGVQAASKDIALAAKQMWLRSDLPIVDEPIMDDITVMVIQ